MDRVCATTEAVTQPSQASPELLQVLNTSRQEIETIFTAFAFDARIADTVDRLIKSVSEKVAAEAAKEASQVSVPEEVQSAVSPTNSLDDFAPEAKADEPEARHILQCGLENNPRTRTTAYLEGKANVKGPPKGLLHDASLRSAQVRTQSWRRPSLDATGGD